MLIPRRLLGLALPFAASGFALGCFLSGDYRIQRDSIGSFVEPGSEPSKATPPVSVASASNDVVAPANSETSPTASAPPAETSEGVPSASPSETASGDLPVPSVVPSEAPSEVPSAPLPEPTSSTPSLSASTSASPSASASASSVPAPSASAIPNPCKAGETVGPNGHCYWFSATKRTWASANTACQTHGGTGWTLATILTEADHQFVTGLLVSGQTKVDTWIGATDADRQEGIWFWEGSDSPFWQGDDTGGPIQDAFYIWGSGEPSGSNGEDCARYRWTGSEWKWSDSECVETYAAICESH